MCVPYLRTNGSECLPPCSLPQALRVSVGKLGVIVRVKLRILREVPVRRELYRMPPPAFLGMMRELQSAARDVEAGTPGAALPKWLDETEWFWVPQVRGWGRASTSLLSVSMCGQRA